MTQNINRTRRSLLAGGTMAALAAATGAAHAKEGAPAFDKIYDVIVVGSGFAGLAAALQARLKGAEVLLIEKMPVFSGNSAINGGAFAVAGSPLQEKEGIKDSPERMLQDMILNSLEDFVTTYKTACLQFVPFHCAAGKTAV